MGIFSVKKALTDTFITPQLRGVIDDREVADILVPEISFSKKGKIITGTEIPTPNGKTTHINDIYLSRKGIFVIRIVNQGGFISGDDTSKNWYASNLVGKVNSDNNPIKTIHFDNPVIQNEFDMNALRRYLDSAIDDDVRIFSIIVFPNDAEFNDIKLSKTKCCICHLRNLKGHIKRIVDLVPVSLDEERLGNVLNILQKNNA